MPTHRRLLECFGGPLDGESRDVEGHPLLLVASGIDGGHSAIPAHFHVQVNSALHAAIVGCYLANHDGTSGGRGSWLSWEPNFRPPPAPNEEA